MSLWPLAVYALLVLVLVAAMLGASWVLGERHTGRTTAQPYESGMMTTGGAQGRISILFYLVAMIFVIFDLEAVFILAWAVAARELGWTGLVEIAVFVGVLVAALAYLWREGALDWGTTELLKRRAEGARGRRALAREETR